MNKINKYIFSCYNENLYFIEISAGAGELEERVEVTETVIDSFSITESHIQMHPARAMAPENAIKYEASIR
jgi:hypothetical protein